MGLVSDGGVHSHSSHLRSLIDASQDFGDELIKNVFDSLFIEDKDQIIERASETDLNGKLMPNYTYLESYLQGIES